MKRRDFLYMAAGATALTTLGSTPLLNAKAAGEATTPFFVRGLAMLKFNDPNYLQIGLPAAPHHAGTLITKNLAGEEVSRELKGHMKVDGVAAGGNSLDVQLPELIQMKELYRDAVGRFDKSPTVVSIPWSAIRGVSTHAVSEDRWTFVWADSGDEVVTFRPRRVAESIQIDLVSNAVLNVNDGDFKVPMASVSEAWTDFTPTHEGMGDFSEHFTYYMPYVNTPDQVEEVVPQKLGRQARRAATGSFGNALTSARLFPFFPCFLVEME